MELLEAEASQLAATNKLLSNELRTLLHTKLTKTQADLENSERKWEAILQNLNSGTPDVTTQPGWDDAVQAYANALEHIYRQRCKRANETADEKAAKSAAIYKKMGLTYGEFFEKAADVTVAAVDERAVALDFVQLHTTFAKLRDCCSPKSETAAVAATTTEAVPSANQNHHRDSLVAKYKEQFAPFLSPPEYIHPNEVLCPNCRHPSVLSMVDSSAELLPSTRCLHCGNSLQRTQDTIVQSLAALRTKLAVAQTVCANLDAKSQP